MHKKERLWNGAYQLVPSDPCLGVPTSLGWALLLEESMLMAPPGSRIQLCEHLLNKHKQTFFFWWGWGPEGVGSVISQYSLLIGRAVIAMECGKAIIFLTVPTLLSCPKKKKNQILPEPLKRARKGHLESLAD